MLFPCDLHIAAVLFHYNPELGHLFQCFPDPNKKELLYTIVYYTSKLWFYGTLIYYGKLKNYGKNYGTISRSMKLRFTNKKNMVDTKK